jgi:hypothetical protein
VSPAAEAPTAPAAATVGCVQVSFPPDDLLARCERMVENGVKTFYFAVVNETPDGRKISSEDVQRVAEVALKLASLQDTKVNTKIYKVPMYRYPGESTEQSFARLQADIVTWIRADGHTDVLTANCNDSAS